MAVAHLTDTRPLRLGKPWPLASSISGAGCPVTAHSRGRFAYTERVAVRMSAFAQSCATSGQPVSDPEIAVPSSSAAFPKPDRQLLLIAADGPTASKVLVCFLLGFIIERMSGSTFEEYMKANIFAPLEMTHSVYDDKPPLTSARPQSI